MSIEITTRQRAFLRAVARNIKADVNIGKAGLTESAVQHIREILQRRELVKLHLLEAAGPQRKQTAQELAASLDALLVDLVGRSVVLYRPNPDLREHERLQLPEKGDR